MRGSIVGARARARVRDIPGFVRRLREAATARGLEVQAFRADRVFGEDHLLSAREKAERAFERGTNVASDRMVEVLLWASGERQIGTALERMGIPQGGRELVLLIQGEGNAAGLLEEVGLERDDALVAGRRDDLLAFGIGAKEVETVPPDRTFDLVLERVALVAILR